VNNRLFQSSAALGLKVPISGSARNDGYSYITDCVSTLLAGWRKPPECRRGWDSRLHNPHGAAATRAVDLGAFCQSYQGFDRVQLEQLLEQFQHPFAVGMQKAEVTKRRVKSPIVHKLLAMFYSKPNRVAEGL